MTKEGRVGRDHRTKPQNQHQRTDQRRRYGSGKFLFKLDLLGYCNRDPRELRFRKPKTRRSRMRRTKDGTEGLEIGSPGRTGLIIPPFFSSFDKNCTIRFSQTPCRHVSKGHPSILSQVSSPSLVQIFGFCIFLLVLMSFSGMYPLDFLFLLTFNWISVTVNSTYTVL